MKKALIFRGGWDGHEPKECTDIFIPWLESKGFEVVVGEDMTILQDSSATDGVNVIIPAWTMGNIEQETWDAMKQMVVNGCGVAGWHGGMGDAFRTATEYQFMVGGQFVDHPGGPRKYTVNIKFDTSGLLAGLKDFEVESEQYYMHVDPGNEVLATTMVAGDPYEWVGGTIMPVVWKRMFDKGRIFYSSLGHVAKEFDVPEVMEIMKRGILWAAGEEVLPEYTSA